MADLPQRSELVQKSTLFPQLLYQVQNPPERLFVLGNLEALNKPSIAVVGARKATPYGLACANRFAKMAAEQGLVVISGGAIGCDQAAHRGALEAGGKTVVVLGCGADVVYPKKAKDLYAKILDLDGALLSEAPWGSAVSKWGFSKRNRIIAALASVTLIVEAGLPSGTFQTADATLALGNELMAVPGSIFSKESSGSNQLISQGAIPIIDDQSFNQALDMVFGPRQQRLNFADAAESTNSASSGNSANSTNNTTNTKTSDAKTKSDGSTEIITALLAQPMLPDQLVGIHQMDMIQIIRMLSKLELAGLIERMRDGRYSAKI